MRPITILIAALGGEGGGVLTNWIVAAAATEGFPAQSTSIPGVAQRTGATTYYIEIVPARWSELGGRRPVLALSPGVGDVDLVVASELLEAGRAVAAGFVTPDRTAADRLGQPLVSGGREDGDGRRPLRLRSRPSRRSSSTRRLRCCSTWRRWRKQSGTIVNAVMLGLIAGSGRLPIAVESFEAAIRQEGKAAEGNLRGFRAGLAAARAKAGRRRAAAEPRKRAHAGGAVARRHRARGRVEHARRRARHHRRGRAPARRLPGPRLCAALSRSPAPDRGGRRARRRRRPPAARDRAPSRGAHVVRGRDPRRPGEDRSGALRPHRRGAQDQAGRAARDHRVPQARHRGNLLAAAAAAGETRSSTIRRGAAGSAASTGAWRSRPRRSPASCASGCWRSCAAGVRAATASTRSRRRSTPGSA